MTENKKKIKLEYFFIAKIIFSICVITASLFIKGGKGFFVFGIIEIVIITILSQKILEQSTVIGNIFNDIFILVINVQFLSYIVTATYISSNMLENINQIRNAIGVLSSYAVFIIIVVIFTFLPIKKLDFKFKKISVLKKCTDFIFSYKAISICLFFELALSMIGYSKFSPIYNLINQSNIVITQNIKAYQYKNKSTASDKEHFYRDDIVTSNYKYDGAVEKPNIVLFFTEGLSKNIIDDERNITPNLKKFENETITFDNYINHTFATFRGIIGQLFSGYQNLDNDTNSLVSIQKLLKDTGYNTTMIGSEPDNPPINDYYNCLGFDKVLQTGVTEVNASVSDKTSYEFLMNHINEQYNKNEPFFSAIYTVGTHATFETEDKTFGDGSDRELNKFYNMDYYFGNFLEEFKKSPAYENTILVFTTDHCTYGDDEFVKAFPGYNRDSSVCDKIPLMIYYKGCKPQKINADFRNSLDLTPTILDFINYKKMVNGNKFENYFLGNSLFENSVFSEFERLFLSSGYLRYVDRNKIVELSADDLKRTNDELDLYFKATQFKKT